MKHLALSIGLVAAAAGLATAQPVVDAPCGSVKGVLQNGVRIFRGIPYAEPPTGSLRWRPPRAKRPWAGIRDATAFGPICPQTPSSRSPSSRMSEDCLNLNVWTPKTATRPLPVMLWVHGGAYVQGAGSLPMYDGSNLARAGAVVITINYRVGPLGFLAHPALTQEGGGESGNYGVQDVILALRWVQTNAAAFGGDRTRVTVFGQSAGGGMGRVLLVSPQARGLFHRMIMQSGPAGHRPYLKRPVAYLPPAESFGAEFAARVLGPGVPASRVLSELRKVDPHELVEKMGGRQSLLEKAYGYGPVIGGHVLPDDPFALMAQGKHANVPTIVGANKNEGQLFESEIPAQTPAEYRAWMRAEYGTFARPLLQALGPVRSAQEAKNAQIRLHGDERFVMTARLGARRLSDSGCAPVYLYTFTRGPAIHGSEIPYVFGMQRQAAERDLSRAMLDTWIRFAAAGDPNGDGVTWPRYRRSSDKHLEWGDSIRTGAGWRASTCDPLEAKFLQDRNLAP